MQFDSFHRARRLARNSPGWLFALYGTTMAWSLLLAAQFVVMGLVTELLVQSAANRPAAASQAQPGYVPLGWQLANQLVGSDAEAAENIIQHRRKLLLAILATSVVLATLISVGRYLADGIAYRLAETVTTELRSRLHEHSLRLSANQLSGEGRRHATELFSESAETVRQGLVTWWFGVPRLVFFVPIMLALALATRLWIGLAAILLACFGWTVLAWLGRRLRHMRLVASDHAARHMANLLERLRAVPLAQRFGMNNSPNGTAAEDLQRLKNAGIARRMVDVRVEALRWFFVQAAVALMIGVVGLNIMRTNPKAAVADPLVLVATLWSVYVFANRLVRQRGTIGKANRAAKTVFSYLDREPHISERSDAQRLGPLSRQLELMGVTLVNSNGHKLLSDVSVVIPARSMVAIMSSDQDLSVAMAQVLTRTCDPTQGTVAFDGCDLREVQLGSVREQVAAILPSGLLFDGTLAENITCGSQRFTAQDVMEVLKAVRLKALVEQWPDGIHTHVGDHGLRLEPSEVLRIGLARAMLRSPSVLVIDEPEEDADPEVAEMVKAAVQSAARNRTVITLARRLSTLRSAEQVLLVHHGRLAAAGTHTDLLENSDLYRHLHYLQFNSFRHPGN